MDTKSNSLLKRLTTTLADYRANRKALLEEREKTVPTTTISHSSRTPVEGEIRSHINQATLEEMYEVYYQGQWVNIVNPNTLLDPTPRPQQKLRGVGAPPGWGTTKGDVYFDESDGSHYEWNGTGWNIIPGITSTSLAKEEIFALTKIVLREHVKKVSLTELNDGKICALYDFHGEYLTYPFENKPLDSNTAKDYMDWLSMRSLIDT